MAADRVEAKNEIFDEGARARHGRSRPGGHVSPTGRREGPSGRDQIVRRYTGVPSDVGRCEPAPCPGVQLLDAGHVLRDEVTILQSLGEDDIDDRRQDGGVLPGAD